MTTTLRPTGPEERSATSGTRSRAYNICVNSRPVGTVRLIADSEHGSTNGRIEGLAIHAADRRRGRATVAALAAEEVLRDWGCRRIGVNVPADAEAALHLTTALGYIERNRTMAKRLRTLPGLPTGSADRPMDSAEFASWLAEAKVRYVQTWVNSGMPRADAEAKSESDHARHLPQGTTTPGAVLRVLAHEHTDVGTLWTTLRMPDQPGGFVFDVRVAEEHRGHGHGRTLMHVAERACLTAGVGTLGLNVFADNTPALRLYTALGYRTTHHHFTKSLL